MNGQTLIIEIFRCEWDRRIEVLFTDEAFDILVEHLKSTGLNVIVEERKNLDYCGPNFDRHHFREVLTAVCEVQGEKLVEGMSVLPALERLVAKYTELKE